MVKELKLAPLFLKIQKMHEVVKGQKQDPLSLHSRIFTSDHFNPCFRVNKEAKKPEKLIELKSFDLILA